MLIISWSERLLGYAIFLWLSVRSFWGILSQNPMKNGQVKAKIRKQFFSVQIQANSHFHELHDNWRMSQIYKRFLSCTVQTVLFWNSLFTIRECFQENMKIWPTIKETLTLFSFVSWHDKLAKTKMQKERKSKKRNRKILNRTDNIQNQSDNQAKEVNSKCSRIRKKLRRTEKKQKYAPEAHPMILLCIRNAAERIFSRRNFIRKA